MRARGRPAWEASLGPWEGRKEEWLRRDAFRFILKDDKTKTDIGGFLQLASGEEYLSGHPSTRNSARDMILCCSRTSCLPAGGNTSC